MARAIILDTETTGREPPEVRSLAALVVGDKLQTFGDVFDRGYTTDQPSTATALSIHRLPELILGTPAKDAWKELIGWAGDFDYIIGHKIDYDWKALGEPDVPRICTLALSRELYDDDEGHSLGAMLCRILSYEDAMNRLAGAHVAAIDVDNCHLIARHLYAMIGCDSLAALHEASEQARIPRRIAFGKYKGQLVAELPKDYCQWYLRQSDTDPWLVKAMEQRLLGGVRKPLAAAR